MENQHLIDHIKQYNAFRGCRCETPEDYLETLRECGEEKYRSELNERRWWKDIFCVTDLDGVEIGYVDAETTGDSSPADIGWEFDLETVCEVERHEEVRIVVTYKEKGEGR